MTLDAIIALAGIAISMTWTPGPNNAMLSASGANYGWRGTIPHALGVSVGFPVMLVLVALGLGQVLLAYPVITKSLGWAGFAMMVWFAWRIATADRARANGRGRPLSFLEAIAFQWVNPKAWAFAIYISTAYGVGDAAARNVLIAAAVFLASGLGSSQVWTLFGAAIGHALGGWRLRAFNIAMAALLLASAVWLMVG